MGSGFLPPVSRLTACFFAFSARNARFLKRALPAAQCAVPIPLPVLWWYRRGTATGILNIIRTL